MRVHYECGGAEGRSRSHEFCRSHHGGFKMQMGVYKARSDVRTTKVYLLFPLQRFRNADDYAVLYSDVSLYYLTGKNIDYPAVLEDHIGLDLTQRGRCQLFELFVFQGSLLSAHAVLYKSLQRWTAASGR